MLMSLSLIYVAQSAIMAKWIKTFGEYQSLDQKAIDRAIDSVKDRMLSAFHVKKQGKVIGTLVGGAHDRIWNTSSLSDKLSPYVSKAKTIWSEVKFSDLTMMSPLSYEHVVSDIVKVKGLLNKGLEKLSNQMPLLNRVVMIGGSLYTMPINHFFYRKLPILTRVFQYVVQINMLIYNLMFCLLHLPKYRRFSSALAKLGTKTDKMIDLIEKFRAPGGLSKFDEETLCLRQRDRVYVDQLAQEKDWFALVGASHLPGKRGMVDLLEKKGFDLEPIDLSAAPGASPAA